jgi:hypothetical protein
MGLVKISLIESTNISYDRVRQTCVCGTREQLVRNSRIG